MVAGMVASRGSAQAASTARRGPAQALWEQRRGTPVEEPGAFCAALLGRVRYALPADVDAPTWRVALRHFAQGQPTAATFRRLLEQRAARREAPGAASPGTRVAAFLLREWERYCLARLVGTGSASRRRSPGRRGRRPAAPRAPRGVWRVVGRPPTGAAPTGQ
jgi:hypothetical protein